MMRIAFYGSSGFSSVVLQKLYELHNHGKLELVYIVSQPSKIFSRKKIIHDNPVIDFCKKNGLTFYTPTSLKKIDDLDFLLETVDISIVAAYGKILPDHVLESSRYGFINFHGSILPQLRGATPVQMTILHQQIDACGLTIIKMNSGMDTGDIIARYPLPVEREDLLLYTSDDLMDKLAFLGSSKLESDLKYLLQPDQWKLEKQNDDNASYCYVSDMSKEKMHIDCQHDTVVMAHGKIMAANPEPIAWVVIQNLSLNIYRSHMIDQKDEILNILRPKNIGTLQFIQKRLFLECCDGFLEIIELQPLGKNHMNASSFGNGYQKYILK